jgi:hypothetical protein
MISEHRPHWWTDRIDTSWEKAKADVMKAWRSTKRVGRALEDAAAEEAVAFGHGARQVYPAVREWSADLAQMLELDWKETRRGVQHGWEDVKDAVRHGWESAKPR